MNKILFVLILTLTINSNFAQKTIGTVYLNSNEVSSGYTLFSPNKSNETYLINNDGEIVHSWKSEYPAGLDVELMSNGTLAKICRLEVDGYNQAGKGGRIEFINWKDSLIWYMEICWPDSCLHHDIEILPNGNILTTMSVKKNLNELLKIGKDTSGLTPKYIWSESIIEIKPRNTNEFDIVWRWDAWDHLVQDKFPNKSTYGTINKNAGKYDIHYNERLKTVGDIFHINSISYNAGNDQILLSVKNLNEIWVIDHSTKTKEAKTNKGGKSGKGGEILYRWGNDETFDGKSIAQLDNQHDANWVIKNNKWTGEISIFNNGVAKKQSCLVVIEPKTNKKRKQYLTDTSGLFLQANEKLNFCPDDFFSGRQSSFQILPNGNFLVGYSAKGEIIEYNSKNEVVWRYVSPISARGILEEGDPVNSNTYFKAKKYNLSLDKLNKK